mgnify:FL=1
MKTQNFFDRHPIQKWDLCKDDTTQELFLGTPEKCERWAKIKEREENKLKQIKTINHE